MMVSDYRKEIVNCINDLKDSKTFYRQIPNLLTLSRMVGVIPVNILYFTGNISLALLFSIILFITDFFDGRIARKYNIVSSFGAKLDAVCDKVMVLGLSIPLISNNFIVLFNLFLEAIISVVNLVKEEKGISSGSSYIGKVKTWVLSFTLGFGYLAILLNIPSIFFHIFSMGTALMEVLTLKSYLSKEEKVDVKKNNEILPEIVLEQEYDYTYDERLEYLKREKENIMALNVNERPIIKKLEKK